MSSAPLVEIPRSQVTVKTALTVTLTVLSVAAVLYVLVEARLAIALTVSAALIATALNHAVEALCRRKLRHGLAVGLVMLAVVAVMTGMLLLLIPPAVSQGRALAEQAPTLLDKARHSRIYESLNARFELDEKWNQARSELPQRAEQAVNPALRALTGVVTGVAAFVTVLFLILFMLLFGKPVVNGLLGEALPSRRARYERMLGKIYTSIGGYLSGLSFICLVNATATTVFLAIIRVPFFLPLGIISGLSSLIPLAGNTVAGVAITLVALATGGVWKGVAVGIYFVLYQQLENHVLGPIVYRRTVNVNPLVIVVALIFFSELAGVAGALIAIPAVATGQIILRELLIARRERFQMPLVAAETTVREAVEEEQHPVM